LIARFDKYLFPDWPTLYLIFFAVIIIIPFLSFVYLDLKMMFLRFSGKRLEEPERLDPDVCFGEAGAGRLPLVGPGFREEKLSLMEVESRC